jgi:hypothetical protein
VNEYVKLVAEVTDTTYQTIFDNCESFEDFKGSDITLRFNIYRVTDTSKIHIGGHCFTELPGCNSVVVSHGTYLTDKTKHSGLSNSFRNLKEKIARGLGYNLMIATCEMSNIPAVGNMFKSKYRLLDPFVSYKSKNLVTLGTKQL